jgi:DNA modification methylase
VNDPIVITGDCRKAMCEMQPESVDAIVTDPPYGLSFMGKGWDHGVPGEEFWTEAMRVAKPGAHLLAFGGTRTYHRLACAIEDAGWEIRDCVMWVYGSGFPKSHDVSKAIDKAAGAERGRQTVRSKSVSTCYAQDEWTRLNAGTVLDAEAITPEAAQWSGWGTALKPAWEPIIVARKPLCGTVAENVVTHGTGGINVDGCRVGTDAGWSYPNGRGGSGWHGRESFSRNLDKPIAASSGRWPANLILDSEAGAMLDEQAGERGGSTPIQRAEGFKRFNGTDYAGGNEYRTPTGYTSPGYGDTGGPSRFFYCAKASKADRNADNHHPTVKPTALMRYLCRLVTPPGGLVLDPFCGSGSTGKAAVMEGFGFVGIEQQEDYAEIARARIAAATPKARLF